MSDEGFNEIINTTNSPFCPGRLLRDCPSTASHDLKISIKERLSKGEDSQKIRESLILKYGDDIDPLPSVSGFGLWAWITPVIFLLLGGFVLARWFSRQKA
jgi:cytochrome c-type biogenesis protein CcmH